MTTLFAVLFMLFGTVILVVLGCLGLRSLRRHERAPAEAARRVSETQLRSVIETAVDGIILADSSSTIISANPAAMRMFGYETAVELIGRDLGVLMTPADAAAHHQYMAAFVETGRARAVGRAGRPLRAVRRDGSEFPIEASVNAFDTDGGRFFTGIVRDVTERDAALAAVAHGREQLAHAQRLLALGELAGGIAHDFNNVLQVVAAATHVMAMRSGDAETQQHCLKLIDEAVARGASITDRLLAIARRGSLAATPVEPAPLLGQIGETLRHTLGHVRIVIAVPSNLPPLLAVRGQLEAVLVNLAVNARDAMPDGGTISLSAAAHIVRQADPRPGGLMPGAYVCITVADTGTGMDAATLARAVEPFFTTKPEGEGTGLGLPMAKSFAESCGGALAIASVPGEGTEVTLWLPQAPAVSEPAAPRAAPDTTIVSAAPAC
jgi:PAS domain S-box-containing protein